MSDEELEAEIDHALNSFDGMLIERKFSEADASLNALDELAIKGMESSVLVSILGITIRAKSRLPSREPFWCRVFSEIRRRKGWWYARGLLRKYR